MTAKVQNLPYRSPYCRCGRELPKGRTRYCFFCKPPKRYKQDTNEMPERPSLEDHVADARSRGLSSGHYMAYLYSGRELPPRIYPYHPPLKAGFWRG